MQRFVHSSAYSADADVSRKARQRTVDRVYAVCLVFGLLVGLSLGMSSCGNIVAGVNNDPNRPSDAPVNLLLPSVQAGVAATLGQELGRYQSIWSQQFVGINLVDANVNNYAITENQMRQAWFSMYVQTLVNAHILINKATAQNAPYYRALGRIMMALGMAVVTDAWGDVPFSEAFQGNGNLTPRFDPQQQIYARLQQILDSAILDLGQTTGVQPASDDMIFGGGAAARPRWLQVAWTLKARLALRLTKRNGVQAARDALQFLQNGITSNANNMNFVFGSGLAEGNQLANTVAQQNNFRIGTALRVLMNSTADPRRPIYARLMTDSIPANTAVIGTFYASTNSPFPYITNAEARFIEAEARLLTGDTAMARAAYLAGVRASLTSFGTIAPAAIDAYLAQPSVTPPSGMTLQQIIEQKYIALFPTVEPYNDWRRTGFPRLTPTTGTQIPRRLPYSVLERLNNPANIPAGSADAAWIFTRVWWDAP
jgi:hypothetical protein